MLSNIGTRLGFFFGILAILMGISIAGNSTATSDRQPVRGATAWQILDGYLAKLGEDISADFT